MTVHLAEVPVRELQQCVSELVDVPVGELSLTRLSGGFSRETWSAQAGGGISGDWIVSVERSDTGLSTSRFGQSSVAQAAVLRDLYDADLPVPKPVAAATVGSATINSLLITERIAGLVEPRDVLALADREGPIRFGAQFSDVLSSIHDRGEALAKQLDPGPSGREWTLAAYEAYRMTSAEFAQDLAATLQPLLRRATEIEDPAGTDTTLVHGDYRVGNVICTNNGIQGVLDWELMHLGDPLEDVAWFRLEAWRYRNGLVGGLLPDSEWLDSYQAASGSPIDADRLWFWDVVGCGRMTLHALETLERTPRARTGWLRSMIWRLALRLEALLS